MRNLLMLLASINVAHNSSITIGLLGNGEVQVEELGNMPTNYQFEEEDISNLKACLQRIVDYMEKDERLSYVEWMGNSGVFIEGLGSDISPVKSEALNTGHIYYAVIRLKELLAELPA